MLLTRFEWRFVLVLLFHETRNTIELSFIVHHFDSDEIQGSWTSHCVILTMSRFMLVYRYVYVLLVKLDLKAVLLSFLDVCL